MPASPSSSYQLIFTNGNNNVSVCKVIFPDRGQAAAWAIEDFKRSGLSQISRMRDRVVVRDSGACWRIVPLVNFDAGQRLSVTDAQLYETLN